MQQHVTQIGLLIIVFLFIIYRKGRKHIGWQRLNYGLMTFRLIASIILGIVVVIATYPGMLHYVMDLVGILIGGALAYFSIISTQFEVRENRMFYKSKGWVGFTLLGIVLARIIYRFSSMYAQFSTGQMGQVPNQNFAGFNSFSHSGDIWTNGIILLLLSYYAIYYQFLLRKRKA